MMNKLTAEKTNFINLKKEIGDLSKIEHLEIFKII